MTSNMTTAPPPYDNSAPPQSTNSKTMAASVSATSDNASPTLISSLSLSDTTIQTSTGHPLYTISSPLTLRPAPPSITISRLSSDEEPTPTPILTITPPAPPPSIHRNLPTGHDFVLTAATPAAASTLGFAQAIFNHQKSSPFSSRNWVLERFVPEAEQTARGDRSVMLHKRELVVKSTVRKGAAGDEGLEWRFVEGGKARKGEEGADVGVTTEQGALQVLEELGDREMDLLVAVLVASSWKPVLDKDQKGLGKADLMASLKHAPASLGRGLGVTEYYVPRDITK